MPSYRAPVEDTLFLLEDVLAIHRHDNLPGFADASSDVLRAVVSEAGKLAGEVLAPLNLPGDREGCTRHPDGSVTTPKASSRPTTPTPRAAGWACRCRRSSAARACRT